MVVSESGAEKLMFSERTIVEYYTQTVVETT